MTDYQDTRILAMQMLYGDAPDTAFNCSTCPNFVAKPNGYFKCAVFGIGNGKATDWRGSFPACGHHGQPRRKGEIPVREICRHSRQVPLRKKESDAQP